MVRSAVGRWLLTSTLVACGSQHGASNGGGAGAGGAGGSGATGGSAEPTPYFAPGSRLKARVFAVGDGPDILASTPSGYWRDTALGLDCSFIPDEEGVERCFPKQTPTGLTGRLYTDASCTRPVLAVGDRRPCREYDARSPYLVEDAGGCRFRAFRVGAELPPSTPLFSSSGTACSARTADEDLGPIYALEPMPADAFVGTRRAARARAPGLDAYVREGDDGSWEIIGYFDRTREAPCFESPSWSPSSKCLPKYAPATAYSDSSCERPSAPAGDCDIEPPTTLFSPSLGTNGCYVGLELYEIEDIRVATPYQLNGSGVCVEVEPAELYHPGERVDLSVLPSLETLVVGAGKARVLFSAFAGIPYLPGWSSDGGAWVNESGGACTPFESPDGTLRCAPPSAVRATRSIFLYEDAACSEAPVVPWFAPLCQADPPLPSVVVLLNETVECAEFIPFSEAFAVAGESTASTRYAKDGTTGVCAPVDPVVTGARYLRLGEALSPTAFPEIERALRE